MREGHYFNEKCLLTSYWVLAIFFSIPQMLHDLSLYLLTLWKKMPLSHLFACHPSRQIKCCTFWKPTAMSLDKVKAYSFPGHGVPVTATCSWNICLLLPMRPLKNCQESGSCISWTRRGNHMLVTTNRMTRKGVCVSSGPVWVRRKNSSPVPSSLCRLV